MFCKWRVSFEGKGIKYLGLEEMRISLDLVPVKKKIGISFKLLPQNLSKMAFLSNFASIAWLLILVWILRELIIFCLETIKRSAGSQRKTYYNNAIVG